MQTDTIYLAAIQMVSGGVLSANLTQAQTHLRAAAHNGAQFVVLPENFALMSADETAKLRLAETFGSGQIQDFLATQAQHYGIWLVGGTIPLCAPDGRVFAASLLFNPDGKCVARYDKIHLFDVNLANGETYRESSSIHPGRLPVVAETPFGRIGLSICYDLRFPELYRALMSPPCDLLVVPAAFTHTTGQAHWELLLRARAVENQCYVLAAAQGGRHENGRRTWGHSMICDPWGEVVAVQAEGEGVVIAEVDAGRIASVRAQLPALVHRRL